MRNNAVQQALIEPSKYAENPVSMRITGFFVAQNRLRDCVPFFANMKQMLLLKSGEPAVFTPISVNKVVNEEYNEVRFSVVSRRLVLYRKCLVFPPKISPFFFLHVPDCERRNRAFFYLQRTSGEIH